MNEKLILVTGIPTSGKTTIGETFLSFPDKCNVIDTDVFGEWKHDHEEKESSWEINTDLLRQAVAKLHHKPTIIVGISDNISQLFEAFNYNVIYLIDHDSGDIADRLNKRYDESDAKKQLFWNRKYRLKYHSADTVDATFSGVIKEILEYEGKTVVKLSVMKIVAEISSLLDR